ncbi:BZ3500_MvSof-1268-A1-R1_Chr1-3g02247 [Microbotryum saponariae]|uniref:BZ3500_MvSof-1268-A1-R1_Chr1-3g02247 protein n=1 Tax=Microbotryum saponariae TaxID=289078 RepID=A0A2X0MFS2_9BASI|nr:BZ3500_MvSof-1268-A1-R1_Chr1-3g02247 [Microbotryum saponariae]SCZ95769.1 BZ3501_MvSof-1269-A2-R1_Chr1-3g01850 [Microbotryum saponariae]
MSTDEYIVIVADESDHKRDYFEWPSGQAAKKWVAGDKTIPLVDIVDSFDVFHTGQGSQGLLQRPSKQELDSVFGTHNDTEIVEIVLEKGKYVTGPAKTSAKEGSASGIANQTSRGAVSGGR